MFNEIDLVNQEMEGRLALLKQTPPASQEIDKPYLSATVVDEMSAE